MCLKDMNSVTDKNMAKHVHCTYAVVGVKWDRSHVPLSINLHSSTIKDAKNFVSLTCSTFQDRNKQ